MDQNSLGRDRDLVLAPGEFAFVLDTTKGLVNTIVGPNKISMSNTDQPVVWNKKERRFTRTDADKAIQTNPIAPEGFYIALYNPADSYPRDGASSVSIPLKVGHRVNLPGPIHFSLWPGQMANVIQGHHLRSNQYLLAQVYNDTEASENWKKAVVKPQDGDGTPTPVALSEMKKFVPGQLIIIKGTEVAFFIPPTGVKVVPDENKNYVREAVTLERLEYCILLGENGNKRFVQGPAVVFPEPTETFVLKDGSRKFRAIELNANSGLYIKVIADYKDGDKQYKVGDELFITGAEQAIYFQREEHSIIRYGDQTKHYAVAIPPGEGRYVLDRNTGEVNLVRGPRMLLCDPRKEVIIRRVLSEKTVRLWYPNNEKVVAVNKELEELNKGDGSSAYEVGRPITASMYSNFMVQEDAQKLMKSTSKSIAGDTFARGTQFTPPRTITLDTKYEGAVSIAVWAGYAVLIVNKTGKRRVVIGPENVLLEYDETLAPIELSTGTPKTDVKLYPTVYLRVRNNKVSDQMTVETQDLVQVTLTTSYRMNFEGDDQKWFSVENYVRLLCDHMRSIIRNAAKRKNITDFYGNTIDIIRDATLGIAVDGKRPGRTFDENGMHVYDIEILDVSIKNPAVAGLLGSAQTDALTSALKLSKEQRDLEFTKESERLKRESATAITETLEKASELALRKTAAVTASSLAEVESYGEITSQKLEVQKAEQLVLNEINTQTIAREEAIAKQQADAKQRLVDVELKRIIGETEEIVKRAAAVDDKLAVALTAFADQELIGKMTVALAPMAAMSGVSTADVLSQLFRGTPFEGVMKTLGTRSRMPTGTSQ